MNTAPYALLRVVGSALVTVAVILGAWWGVVAALALDPFSAKTPADVWRYLLIDADAVSHRGALASALGATLYDAALGYIAGLFSGCALATMTSLSRTAEHAILPAAMVLQSIPLAAISPIIALVFGEGTFAVAAVAAIVVFFPTFVNVVVGLGSASKEATELMRAYGATPWQTFWKVRIPSAVPALLTSARIAVPGALIGVLVAEWLVSGNGVGQFMIVSQNTLDYTALWSAAAVLTLTSALLYSAAGMVEGAVLAKFATRYAP